MNDIPRVNKTGGYPRMLADYADLRDELSKLTHPARPYQRGITIIISQLPVSEWYKLMGNPTLADALVDRLLHNGHRVELRGESMSKLAQTDQTS